MTIRTLTIFLADLVGSSTRVTAIPQDQAVDYLFDAMLPVRQAVESHDGKVIKFTGDGYLATFEAVSQALRAAEQVRHYFLRQSNTPAGFSLDGVRIVLHTADITLQDDDIVGDGVVLTTRLEKSVPTNHIYVTQPVRDIADDAEFSFADIGSMTPRGWRKPVKVYQLVSTEASYTETGICLLITDLHGLILLGESLSTSEMIQWMEAWGDLHRQATAGLQGRVRQFTADMVLATFANADDAVRAVLNLRKLATLHNANRTGLPPIQFKAAISRGDLILSATGVVGRLVNTTFSLLNALERGQFGVSVEAYRELSTLQNQFQQVTFTAQETGKATNAFQYIGPVQPQT